MNRPLLRWTPSPETNKVPPPPDERSFPPWGTPCQWLLINHRIDRSIREQKNEVERARRSAEAVDYSLKALFPLMEALCGATCRLCPSPCCFTARVYFDLRDLLFLHLMEICVPPHQPIRHTKSVCHYLGSHGCLLPRRHRPWICTWYLCPTQTLRIRSRKAYHGNDIFFLIEQIKQQRKQLEAFLPL